MKSRYRIVLCTEADGAVGLGHAVRCKGLLDALPVKFDLIVVGNGAQIGKIFPEAIYYSGVNWMSFDWSEISVSEIDLILADIPFYKERDWSRIRRDDVPMMVIDDHGGLIDADVVINGTVLPAFHRYERPARQTVVYTGASYALVRREFAIARWRPMGDAALVVVVGSGEAARTWAHDLVSDSFNAFHARSVRVVVGASFRDAEEFRALCVRHDVSFSVGLGAAELSRCLSTSDAALITAGMILYEAITVGIPTVAYPQIPDLVPEAAWFAAAGACIDLGIDGGAGIVAATAVNRILDDAEFAANMHTRQLAILDGCGMDRVAEILLKLIQASP